MSRPSAPPKHSAAGPQSAKSQARARSQESTPCENLDDLARSLRSHREQILDEWLKGGAARAEKGGLDADTIRIQSGDIIDGLAAVAAHGEIGRVDGAEYAGLIERLDTIARSRAASKAPLVAVGRSLSSLKETLAKWGRRNGWGEVDVLLPVIDGLVFSTFERVLTRRERFINAIIESAAYGIVTIDQRGIVHTFNAAAEEMFGYDRIEVVGQNVKMLVPQPHRDRYDVYLSGYLTTGEAKILGFRREVEGLRKDGNVFPMELAVCEVTEGDERTFSGTLRDLTEIKRAKLELERKTKDILELSTPVISVWEGVLVLPLIGTLDSHRAQDCIEKALGLMAREEARVLIIDITGVAVVDTMVANHLINMAASIRLMGGHCVLTGIAPNTAMTIVSLGIDLSALRTCSTLARGLKLALELVGARADAA